MTAKFKKMLIAGIAILILAVPFMIYAFFPSPIIDDGYLENEVRKVSYKAPFTIGFSQSMNRQSVEANFSITPSLKGKFIWKNSKTISFQSDKILSIKDEYKVTIASNAKSKFYKKLGRDYVINFVVSGAPYVRFVSPMPDSGANSGAAPASRGANSGASSGIKTTTGPTTVPTIGSTTGTLIISDKQAVTVMMDRPIRALTTLSESSKSQKFPDLQITPAVKGTYKWIGTSAFQFVPEKWTMGTTYTLKLPKGITTLDGGKTEKEVIWQLATEAPKIVSSFPTNKDDTFSPKGEIKLTFNQPIELGDVKPGTNVLLYPSNDKDASETPKKDGFFNTTAVYGTDEKGKTDKTVLIFKPLFDYQYNQNYKLVIKPGLKGNLGKGYGDRAMEKEYSLEFTTVKKPSVLTFSPKNGDKNYKGNYIEIDFASPITEDLIKKNLVLTPKPTKEPRISISKVSIKSGTVWQAYIYYGLERSKDYTFEIKGPFKDSLGNTAEKGFKTSFKTAPTDPYLELLTRNNFGLFMDGMDPVYAISSVNVSNVDIKLCDVSEKEFFSTNSDHSWYKYECKNAVSKNIKVKNKLNETQLTNLNLTEIFNKKFTNGTYYFQVSSSQYKDGYGKPYHFYQTSFISNTNLVIKKADKELLVWATDLKTGQPIPSMKLRVISSEGKDLATAVTDKNGLSKINNISEDDIYIIGTKGNGWAMIGQYWNSGIQNWEYGTRGEYITLDEPRVYLYTERPIYKPGDTIFFKGIYRIDKDLDLSIPKDKKVRLTIEDPEYNKISTQDINLLADGSFNGSFVLGSKVKVGRYNLYAETIENEKNNSEYAQRFYHYFYVEEYKKPQFKIQLLNTKTDYKVSEPIDVELQANYYFGGAIDSGKVSWTLMSDTYSFNKYKGSGYYSFGTWGGFDCFWYSCSSNSETVAEGKGTLDTSGRIQIKLPAKKDPKKGESYLYTLNATVTNKDGEVVTKRETFIIHQGSYYIGLSPKNYIVKPNDNLQLNVITVDPNGKAVAGKKVILEVYEEKWNTVKKKGIDGAFYDTSVKELKFVKKQNVTTGTSPVEAKIVIDADMSGSYVVHATSEDDKNNIFSETDFYVSSGHWVNWGSSNDNKMELVLDQPQYFVGGKARLLIKSPYGSKESPAKALVTYERAGIQYYEVIDIKSNSDTIDIPIKDNMAPNVYITVLVVKGSGDLAKLKNEKSGTPINFNLIKPDFKFGITNLIVSKREHEILIDIKTNKENYKVGEEVEMQITTSNYKAQPVSSIVSLAVVDESLLALKANTKISPLDYFYGERSLQVDTAASLTAYVDRVDVNSKKGAKGGGGDGKESEKSRGEFKDTAYFNPLIKTDGGGKAVIKFKPPDNLTTWEIWAVASSGKDKFGMKKEDFIVKKPVAITSILPRFVISNDRLIIGALVHNQSGEEVKTKVELKSNGLNIKESAKKSLSMKNGESKKVDWMVEVKSVNKDSDLTIEFISEEDTVKYSIPVKTFSFPEVVATNGTTKEESTEKVIIPSDINTDMGGLDIRVGGSLLTKIIKQFTALKDYPYGCAEQITSKILPTLVLKYQSDKNKDINLFKFLNIDEVKSKKIIQDTLQKLSTFQRFDGGYGFWAGSTESYPMLTSYILYAQHLSSKSGFTVNKNNFNLAIQYLWKALNNKDIYDELSLDDRAFALWVLSETGKNDTGMTLALYEKREDLKLYSKALMLMNMNNLYKAGQKSVKPFTEKLKAEIVSKQIIKDRTIYFEEDSNSLWDINTDRRTTSMILMALNRDNPNNPVLPNIVNYLTSSSNKRGLVNTQETSWVLMAMLEYSEAQDVLTADFKFNSKLNNKATLSGSIKKDNLTQVFEKFLTLGDLKQGNNNISFNKEGSGQMIYDMELKYYLPNEKIKSIEKGFNITRNYYEFDTGIKNTVATAFKSGTVYRGELTVIVPDNMHYVVVEERLPAGFEAINFNLDTSDTSLQTKLAKETKVEGESYYWYDNPLWRFNHKETRDDRLLLFADYLPKGVYTYSFLVRAGLPGKYNHLPASAYQMYFPEVFGRTEGKYLEVK